MKKIERVARAINHADWCTSPRGNGQCDCDDAWTVWVPAAKAAIEAAKVKS